MTTAEVVPIPAEPPPMLLLDTNVFRDLADGKLTTYEKRLLEIAKHRSPPLLWTCPIVGDEIEMAFGVGGPLFSPTAPARRDLKRVWARAVLPEDPAPSASIAASRRP